MLSRHKSPYLVRYYQTSIENYNKENYKDDSDFEEIDEISTLTKRKNSLKEISKTTTLEKNESETKNYLSDGIEFSDEEDKKEDNKMDILGDDDDENEEEEEKESESKDKKEDTLIIN